MKILTSLAVASALLFSAQAASAAPLTISEAFSPVKVVDDTHTFNVGTSGTITDVNITIDLTKCDGSISSSGACLTGGYSYNYDIVFDLISPDGTTVSLIAGDTFSGQTPGARVSITFDDAAATLVGGSVLSTGSFQPIGSLARLIGEEMAGIWSIHYRDTAGADSLSFNGYSITFNSSPSQVPLPAGVGLLAMGLMGLGAAAKRRRKA